MGGDGPPVGERMRVLFVCTLNAVRSPMAHALSSSLLAERVHSESAGVYHADPVDPLAVAAMREIGLDITAHHPHTVADLEARGEDVGAYDLIVTLSGAARDAAEALARGASVSVEHWPVADPSRAEGAEDARMAAYRQTRDDLRSRLLDRFGGA